MPCTILAEMSTVCHHLPPPFLPAGFLQCHTEQTASAFQFFWDSFMQVISEIALLVIVGAILGIFLTYPIADWISGSFFNNGDEWQVSLIENLDYLVILCGVFPLSLLFTLLSGGIPAYIIARKNIATVLKGGSK